MLIGVIMAAAASFNLVPNRPFTEEELDTLRARLGSFPVYHEPAHDLYVFFGSPEERRETVALYARATTPTFDVECFVQLRADKFFVHPGSEGGGRGYLREFLMEILSAGPHRLVRGEVVMALDEVLPPGEDLERVDPYAQPGRRTGPAGRARAGSWRSRRRS